MCSSDHAASVCVCVCVCACVRACVYACVCLCVYACRRTVTKRTFGQTGLVIHTWYASHSLIKTIWVMAISQHQFYLNRKQSKVSQHTHMTDEVCSVRLHIYVYLYKDSWFIWIEIQDSNPKSYIMRYTTPEL